MKALADVTARGLRQAGMAVDISPDGESAIEQAVLGITTLREINKVTFVD